MCHPGYDCILLAGCLTMLGGVVLALAALYAGDAWRAWKKGRRA